MRTTRRVAATGIMAAAAALSLAGPAHADLADHVAGLTVAAEQPAGYDRDLFGDYDRDALLDASFADWPDCDGYYSQADDHCWSDASDVDVDHIVALAEAWESGAHAWSDAQRDEFAGDPANLWLMTDNLNQSKGADDPAEWLPPHAAAVCTYLQRYVAVKVDRDLSVDQAEKAALTEAAAGCTGNDDDGDQADDGDKGDSGDGAGDPSPAASQGGATGQEDESLPATGNPAALIGGGALVLLATGGAVFIAARRRRTTFTA